MSKKMLDEDILQMFDLFDSGSEFPGAIDSWLNEKTPKEVLTRLSKLNQDSLTFAQFNELLVYTKVAPVSEGYFSYYWLETPEHPYDTRKLPKFETDYKFKSLDKIKDETNKKRSVNLEEFKIISLDHLYWGIYRIFMDGLLYYGNINFAYHDLRMKNREDIKLFFDKYFFDTKKMSLRGKSLALTSIEPEDRHLISEAACKNLEEDGRIQLISDLKKSYEITKKEFLEEDKSYNQIQIKDVVGNLKSVREREIDDVKYEYIDNETKNNIKQKSLREFNTTFGKIYNEYIKDPSNLDSLFNSLVKSWEEARPKAIANTKTYLSRIGELDVYVATSMRTIEDFEKMSNLCNFLFKEKPDKDSTDEDIKIHNRLEELFIRFFDPTMSAAKGHEDKGIIECLMVKLTKVLILYVGTKDSFGKDVEAAMALSLGKPVIFLCENEARLNFYKNIHPLSRLIRFDTGVAGGAIICKEKKVAKKLLYRIFYNKMRYYITLPERKKGVVEKGYYRLKEKLTDSVVRVQTNDKLLTNAFWDHYHKY